MGDIVEQLFPTINIFIELEDMMEKHIMVMFKNARKQKLNGKIYPNYKICHLIAQAVS